GRKRIGFFVGSNFFPYMTAKQNLEYYRQVKGITDKNEVNRVLEIVELGQVKSKYKAFSMGMHQRSGPPGDCGYPPFAAATERRARHDHCHFLPYFRGTSEYSPYFWDCE
ncbi:MAG: hypothetical protein ACRC2P_12720, partial [Eubacterium aggregans]